MNPDEWQKVKSISNAALDREPDVREEFLGDAANAFETLKAAADKRDTLLVYLKENGFVGLHSDPRWKQILRRLNFPDA